MMLKIGTEVYR